MAFALLPRGLRVKNWKVEAFMALAVCPMARKPSEGERWQPIWNIGVSSFYKRYTEQSVRPFSMVITPPSVTSTKSLTVSPSFAAAMASSREW